MGSCVSNQQIIHVHSAPDLQRIAYKRVENDSLKTSKGPRKLSPILDKLIEKNNARIMQKEFME